jgi:hypothetical protein
MSKGFQANAVKRQPAVSNFNTRAGARNSFRSAWITLPQTAELNSALRFSNSGHWWQVCMRPVILQIKLEVLFSFV